MRRVWLLATLLLCSVTAQAAGGWSDLWRTPDQRGDAYLRQGDAAAAARTFADPRRKAFAELQAGQYQAAAQGFAAFGDRDAHYNRGNALARAGDLQHALDAYDAALKQDPNDRDTHHNRDLVAKAQQQQQQQGQGKSGQGQSGRGPSPSTVKDTPPPPAAAASAPGQPDHAAPRPEPGQDANSNSNSSGDAGAAAARRRPQAGLAPAKAASQPAGTDTQPARRAPDKTPQDAAAQARRDVAASLEHGQQPASAASAASGDGATDGRRMQGAHTTPNPRTEQQLAEDQWLRRIPDDPGGLLRRKFLIQHMQRQGAQ